MEGLLWTYPYGKPKETGEGPTKGNVVFMLPAMGGRRYPETISRSSILWLNKPRPMQRRYWVMKNQQGLKLDPALC
jgi:hypothetical protein